MLKSHIDAVEDGLLAISKIPANAGHTLNRGTPREAFIKEFLINHLSEKVAIGTGEIIDSSSSPRQQRNQIDIVIYRRDYPKLSLGGGINAFLAESVVAIIEVKSLLTEGELNKCIKATRNIKSLKRNIVRTLTVGHIPPGIISFVIAYDGPASMQTVYSWIPKIHEAEGINLPQMGSTGDERILIQSPSVDAIFVLGKGFIQFDNSPIGFCNDDIRKENPESKWIVGNITKGSLLLLFLLLFQASSGMDASRLDPLPYLKTFSLEDVLYGK
jgi:hypothetical protein